jgi:hypothetical protein
MAYSTITKPKLYFETTTYTGGATDVSSLSFQPDFVWVKKRDGAENYGLFDAVRGATKTLNSNTTSAEDTRSGSLTSFDNDGWSMGGSDGIISASGSTYVGWAWKAGTGQGSSNTDGSINTTYTSVNTTAGFSINQYTGTGATATVGHGLGAIPDMMIIKRYSDAGEQWTIYHKSLGPTKHILFTTGAQVTQANYWNDTAPTNLVWTMGNQSEINGSGATNICYAFAEKKGYSKFGTYTGNGTSGVDGAGDGTFVYTGFKPSMIFIKPTSTTGNWQIHDTKRDGYNVKNDNLAPNNNAQEADNKFMDILSNGFKLRSGTYSASGVTYIYMAFAEEPLVANVGQGIPATAR